MPDKVKSQIRNEFGDMYPKPEINLNIQNLQQS